MNLRLKASTFWRQGSLLVTLVALATVTLAEEADDNFYRCIPGMESVGGKTQQLSIIYELIQLVQRSRIKCCTMAMWLRCSLALP